MRKVYLISAVVVLLVLVAAQAMAELPWRGPEPPNWVPQAAVPVELTVDGYGKIEVVNSALNLEIQQWPGPEPSPDPWYWPWPEDFVYLDIEANFPVILDVTASDNGRLRSDEGAWFKPNWEKGTYLEYYVCGGWANTPDEFTEYMGWPSTNPPGLGSPVEGLGPGAQWLAPYPGYPYPDPYPRNHLWQRNWETGEWTLGFQIPYLGQYPPGYDGESWAVTLGGWAGVNPGRNPWVPVGVYRGELTLTISPQVF